eukprot:CAMPEP_0114133430 /NCGR_PEP_ID=MMETSP0043_2-20121206/13624_1 /TAXON_ID=464988 /ORGANISM="Hemiselmis andersenii, Strain CCMP644" /LENGTH=174 /DNA_ID=CAMNT_0001227011 /DNA_START=40 /DNA_END=564 /DNA_ORIENTATION=-
MKEHWCGGLVECCDSGHCDSYRKYCQRCSESWATCDACEKTMCPDCVDDGLQERTWKFWPCCKQGGSTQMLCNECNDSEDEDEDETEEEHGLLTCQVCSSPACGGSCAVCKAKEEAKAKEHKRNLDIASTHKDAAFLVKKVLPHIEGPSLRELLEDWVEKNGEKQTATKKARKA